MENLPDTTANNEAAEVEKTKKQRLWEYHHAQIQNCIVQHLEKNGSMPSKTIIADETGLSRETVYKHLQAGIGETANHAQLETFGGMVELVMAQVLKASLRGDLNAARLFLETTKGLNISAINNKKAIQQNNYVQINKTVINQQIIQQLKPEQLQQIEQIITAELENNALDNG